MRLPLTGSLKLVLKAAWDGDFVRILVPHLMARLCLILGCLGALPLAADPLVAPFWRPQAAPAPPPAIERPDAQRLPALRPLGSAQYSIGDPTDEEQYYLELINRARANPPAEGARLSNTTDPDILAAVTEFGVDQAMLVAEFGALRPAPPLAFHGALIEAARGHSGDMFTNVFQGHVSWDGRTLEDRLRAVGYPYSAAAENVFSYAQNPFHGHAAFQIDWGPGVGGMQGPPRGHRESIHEAAFREVGIGIVNGGNARPGTLPVGPQLVTQNFGARPDPEPLVTGVAYYDLNGNGIYDVGEGLGGIRVDVEGSEYYAVTGAAGGYAVPVPGNGVYNVTFTGPDLPVELRQVLVTDSQNLKVDYRPTYQPPTITGPDSLVPGERGSYTFSPVGAATDYALTESRQMAYTRIEGAEQGIEHLILAVSPGYAVQDFRVAASGNASFHLAMPLPESQTLELPDDLRPGPGGRLLFASRLGYAFSNQVARAQVSTNRGGLWVDVWSRPGETTDPDHIQPGQLAFETVTVPLDAFAGRDLRVRFRFSFEPGYRFYETRPEIGWHLDDIRFTGVYVLDSPLTRTVTTAGFDFQPMAEGTYTLRVQPRVSGRWFTPGPDKQVAVSGSPLPVVRIETIEWIAVDRLRLEFSVVNGPPASLQLETRNTWTDAWMVAPLAELEETVPGSRYRFTVDTAGARQLFYRVRTEP